MLGLAVVCAWCIPACGHVHECMVVDSAQQCKAETSDRSASQGPSHAQQHTRHHSAPAVLTIPRLCPPPLFAGAVHQPIGALLMCMQGNVDMSVVNGEVVIRDGAFTTCDLAALVREHNTRSRAICKHLGPTPK